jgi:translation initiation factor IF-3
MSENNSQANAGTTNATDGSASAATETQTNTTTAPNAEEVLKGDNVDAIRELMRANDDALVQSKRDDPWKGLDEDDTEQTEETETETAETESNAEAEPGDEATETETHDESTEGKGKPEDDAAAKAQAEAEAAAAAKQRDAKNVRLKRDRFGPEVQPIIDRMAEKRNLSFEEAKAELVAEGKLKAESATAAAAPPAKAKAEPDTTATEISTKQAEIADLEKQIEDAGKAYDTAKLSKLSIAHNKALSELGKLESKADSARAAAQAQEQIKMQSAVHEAEKAAIEMFPDAGVKGSELYEEIEDQIAAAKPEVFADPDWPITLAAKAARAIGYKPAAPAAAAKPVVVPKKPVREVPPGPASGASLPAGAAKTPSLEERAKAAENDEAALKALLREAGTRSLD